MTTFEEILHDNYTKTLDLRFRFFIFALVYTHQLNTKIYDEKQKGKIDDVK